jgi:uncharacterized phage protein (TIGR01671 family)
MREFKFRAYHYGTREMLGENETGKVFQWNYQPIDIMQFTGLNDKNGKDIYEGDILKFPDTGEEGYEYKEGFDFANIASVVFENGRFELTNFISDNSGVLDEMNDCHEDFISVFSSAEIIGNIYENPELLEVRNV